MKKINVLGLVALFVAGGMALAFNNAEVDSLQYYNSGSLEEPNWEPLTRVMGNTPGTYKCELLEDAVCTASFDTPPAQDQPAPSNAKPGIYIENN